MEKGVGTLLLLHFYIVMRIESLLKNLSSEGWYE